MLTCMVDQYVLRYREVGTSLLDQKTMGAPLWIYNVLMVIKELIRSSMV